MDPSNYNCHNDCAYHILLIQARTRQNLSMCLVSSFKTTVQRLLKGFKLQGWPKLDESKVKEQVDIAVKAGNKSRADIKNILETLVTGCKECLEKDARLYEEPCQSQNADYYADYMTMEYLLQNL